MMRRVPRRPSRAQRGSLDPISIMMPFFSSPPLAAAALSFLLAGGAARSGSERADVARFHAVADDPSIRCAANRATSDAVLFERIDLRDVEHSVPRETYALLYGPRVFTVVADSTMWPAVWRAAVDSVKPFPVAFDGAVLVLAATNTFGPGGGARLEIVSIRACRRTGVVVVSTIETRERGPVAIMMRSRGFDLVRVRRLNPSLVLFDQHVRWTGLGR